MIYKRHGNKIKVIENDKEEMREQRVKVDLGPNVNCCVG